MVFCLFVSLLFGFFWFEVWFDLFPPKQVLQLSLILILKNKKCHFNILVHVYFLKEFCCQPYCPQTSFL